MKLYSLLLENHVVLDEPVGSLEAALRRMVVAFGEAVPEGRRDELVATLMEREESHPTFIADQIALPHARLPWLDRFLVGLLVPARPFRHVAEDEPPVAVLFMILAPQTKNAMMLQTLAAIARLLKSREMRTALMKTKSPGRLIRQIEESGIDIKKTLMASDVMTPITHKVTTDTILAHAVDVLVDAPDEGIPVMNEHGKLTGEITSRELLALGMPKYVDLLINPAMLENFEPFENFFQHENTLKVREICRRDIITVPPTAPIVQVTHLMMTRQKRRIYVVDDGELLGIIMRKNIIARVLHF